MLISISLWLVMKEKWDKTFMNNNVRGCIYEIYAMILGS